MATPDASVKISLSDVSKHYNKTLLFSHLNYSFEANERYAILGINGAGKSSLMRILAGMQAPSSGKVIYENEGKSIPQERVFPLLSYCAPGMDIPDELTLTELIDFHFTFRKTVQGVVQSEIPKILGLLAARNKPVGDYSSGMKQRVKLGLAIFSETPVLLLDEPCTNLDQAGVEQYLGWIERYGNDRLVIVASNDTREYGFCKALFEIG